MTQRHVVVTVNAAWNLLNYRVPIIRMLQDMGCRVTLLAPEDDTTDALRALGCAFEPIEMTRRGKSPIAEAGVYRALHAALRRLRPDAVISFTIKNNLYAGIACRRLGIPFLPNVSGRGAIFSEGRLIVAGVMAAYRLAFGRAATVFYQNPEDRAYFLSRGVGRPAQAALLPGSGVDLDRFSQTPLPASPDAPVFLMIARVLRDKGVQEYADAARAVQERMPGARFVLVGAHGDGREYVPAADLERWQSEGVIDYRGAVPDIRPLISEADAVVLPSYYLEGTPRALIESAAMGRPIVTTDTAGCRDTVIAGTTGLLVPPRDSRALARALGEIAAMSPDARADMGNASRALAAERFDIALVVAAYRDALCAAFDEASTADEAGRQRSA